MYKQKLIAKVILLLVLSGWIISVCGIAGLIDGLQFIEMMIGMLILAFVLNRFRLNGLAYRAEKSGIIIGIIGTTYQMIWMYKNYGSKVIELLWLCSLSLLYGLMFSTLNTLMIYKRKKRDESV